jgi:transposase
MGTIPHTFETAGGKRPYRRHSSEFKQTIVEHSYAAGASVARLAQLHQINANQIFAWRKWVRDQRTPAQAGPESAAVFLPITVSQNSGERADALPEQMRADSSDAKLTDRIELTVGAARLSIHGAPDASTLRAVLAQLLR